MNEVIVRTPVAIVGAGRLGSALALALFHRGAHVGAVISRTEAHASLLASRVSGDVAAETVTAIPAGVGIVLVCTGDDAVESVAEELAHAALPHRRLFVAHCSGVLTSEVLAPVGRKGARVASVHPAQSFAGRPEDWRRLAGIYYGVEGDERSVPLARELVRFLGGMPVTIPKEAKPAYHLSCALISNYSVALLQASAELLAKAGLEEVEATRFLLPLFDGTVRNVRVLGLKGAVTGPLARGDERTVAAHLEILRREKPELVAVYQTLGRVLVALGRQRGSFDETKSKQIERLLGG